MLIDLCMEGKSDAELYRPCRGEFQSLNLQNSTAEWIRASIQSTHRT